MHCNDSLTNESGSVDEAVDKLVNCEETPKEPAKEEDNVLAKLSKIYDSEGVVSDAVDTQLATLVDKMVKTMLSEHNAKEKLAKYIRPQNYENLVSTRVSPEIWGEMRSNSKSKDLRIQKIDTSMLRRMHPVINLADKLLVLKNIPHQVSVEDVSSFLRFALDSLTLMAHSVYELNLCSRELIRPQASNSVVGDLAKAAKEISETNKVSQRVSYPKHELIQRIHTQETGVISRSSKTFFCTLANPRGESPPRNSERGREQINKKIQSSSVGKQGEPPYSYINSLCGR